MNNATFVLILLAGAYAAKTVWIMIDYARIRRVLESRGAVEVKLRVTPLGKRNLDERFMRLYTVEAIELDGSRFRSVYVCPPGYGAYVLREECLDEPAAGTGDRPPGAGE